MKRLLTLLISAALLTGCAPIETARLYWVVFWHDYGQRLLFEVMSWVR